MAKEGLHIYNSMKQSKELFTPLEPGKVRMYVCGVTTYDYSHLGHGRAAVSFDVLFRYLKYLGYEVTYVRNFTDVDDKIIARAKENTEPPLTLSSRFCDEYLKDMDALQCLRPTHEPRVSEHMVQIIEMITKIISNDCAYVVGGDVFFSVEKSSNYGQLSKQKLDNNRAGERVAVDSRKRHPADFALWKSAKPDEIFWDSPWGRGRPGWHIECSAMSANYLTTKFDIHGGGIDLIFPHHENEIAQSGAACQDSCVNYWMHNGHVTNNNEKMSKSLGNFFTIRQIIASYHPLALRHFLISAYYRSPLNYSVLQLDIASDAIYYIYQTLQDLEDTLSPLKANMSMDGPKAQTVREAQECINKLRAEFQTKMSDDLNTSQILTGAFQDSLKYINSSLTKLKKLQQKKLISHVQSLEELKNAVVEVLEVLGLRSPLKYIEVLEEFRKMALVRAEMKEDDILSLIDERKLARNNKDFAKSDKIRADLTLKGIALMDIGKEIIWRPCVPTRQEKEELQTNQAPTRQQEVSPTSQAPQIPV